MLFLLGIVIGAVLVGSLSGCGSQSVRALPSSDRYGVPRVALATCDLGILRGTKEMRCVDEFKRKGWFYVH